MYISSTNGYTTKIDNDPATIAMFTFITKSTYETNFGRLITWETLLTDAPGSVYLLYSDTDDSHILFRQLSSQSSYHCYVERRWYAN